MTDAELIEAYSSRQDEGAFGELMRRHGAMVYRACHRLLKDPHEAEDASQAVFVVLARKAAGLRRGDLAAWLYRVAHLVAAETVRKRMHRAKREESYAVGEAIQAEEVASIDVVDPGLLGLVDAALLSLPERYREAVILRYLQNHSEAEAAQRAGCAVGTLSARASRGIERLRQRLAKRGVALGGVALVSLLTSEASAAVPETLLPSILAVVKTAVATTATATAATSSAVALAKGAMKTMFMSKVKMMAAVVAAVVVAGSGAIVAQKVAQRKAEEQPPATQTQASPIQAQTAAPSNIVVRIVAADAPDRVVSEMVSCGMSDPESIWRRASLFYKNQHWSKCMDTLKPFLADPALRTSPLRAEALFILAHSYMEMSQNMLALRQPTTMYPQAMKTLLTIMEDHEDFKAIEEVYTEHARLAIEVSEWAVAAETCKRFAAKFPNSARKPYLELYAAAAQIGNGNADAGAASLRGLTTADTFEDVKADAYYRLAMVSLCQPQPDKAAALELLCKGMACYTDAKSLLLAATCACDMNDWHAAMKYLDMFTSDFSKADRHQRDAADQLRRRIVQESAKKAVGDGAAN